METNAGLCHRERRIHPPRHRRVQRGAGGAKGAGRFSAQLHCRWRGVDCSGESSNPLVPVVQGVNASPCVVVKTHEVLTASLGSPLVLTCPPCPIARLTGSSKEATVPGVGVSVHSKVRWASDGSKTNFATRRRLILSPSMAMRLRQPHRWGNEMSGPSKSITWDSPQGLKPNASIHSAQSQSTAIRRPLEAEFLRSSPGERICGEAEPVEL